MRILIGVSGSIAAIKVPLLIHKIISAGYECKVVVTNDGLNFITPMAISSLGADVFLDNNYKHTSAPEVMQHINLGKWADYIVLVPASANTIAKLSAGFADNLLTATVLASNAHKIIVPAMNQLMWKNSITTKNVNCLKENGFDFWGPTTGLQACGDNDIGRMLEVEEIFIKITGLKTSSIKNLPLSGKKVVITVGATKEAIDPVRYITNHSSGKMGFALAKEALKLGAEVTLINASNKDPIFGVQNVKVTSGKEMLKASLFAAKTCDIFIGCAAVCDYQVNYTPQKIKKLATLNLELTATPDILKMVREENPNLFMVGFAAETENLIPHAQKKLIAKKLDLIIANDVSNNKVFNQDYSEAIILDKNSQQYKIDYALKEVVAAKIIEYLTTAKFQVKP